MTITPCLSAGFTLTSASSRRRSSGVHLSGVLRRMALTAGKLPAQYADSGLTQLMRETPFNQAGSTPALCKAACGMAWEDWIARHIAAWAPGFQHQPGEIERDGITGSPDGFSKDGDDSLAIHEVKFTWKSANRNIADEWLWLAQISGYAAILRAYAVECRRAYLHVLYAMGNYKRDENGGPCYQVYEIGLDPVETERAWAEIVANKELAEPENWEEE